MSVNSKIKFSLFKSLCGEYNLKNKAKSFLQKLLSINSLERKHLFISSKKTNKNQFEFGLKTRKEARYFLLF